jgi:tetraacyldisaccharide 4'-kinase
MKALLPFSPLYGGVVALRNLLYDRGVLEARRLDRPVVSVGNIRAGGTGKTPFIIKLGQMLQERGIAFDVLSRGYRRDNEKSIKLVDPKGSPAEFGDEPLVIARALGVPVMVGADRYAAGKMAEKMFAEMRPAHGGKWIHLLDDGFQHRRLHRDFDIVLVSATDAADALLPAGRLREPWSSLRRASALVLTDDTDPAQVPADKPVWRARRKLAPGDLPARPIAFCGIARPEGFFEDLKRSGIEAAGTVSFEDHHRYIEADVQRLRILREQKSASGFVTTEKDLINLQWLKPEVHRQLQPLKAVSMELVIDQPDAVLRTILDACAMQQ